MPESQTRAMTFIALVTANLALIVTNLSWKKIGVVILNKSSVSLRIVLGLAVTALFCIMNIPILRDLFHFSALGLREIITAVIAGGLSLVWFELFKLLKTKQAKAGNN
jgi:Ca2+-transporting ATPase